MRKSLSITVESNLLEFFKDLVTRALRNQKVDADEMVEFYLVQLLARFHEKATLTTVNPQTGSEEPYAITYLRGLNSNKREGFDVLKNLGDRSLYLSGFFSEHFQSSSVGLDYYISLGGHAYQRVSEMVGHLNPQVKEMFLELGKNFPRFVDILSEISADTAGKKDSNLLRMYEKWLATGDQHAAEILTKAGIPLSLKNNTVN